jgi:hypothetical protein
MAPREMPSTAPLRSEWSGVWTGYAVFAGVCILLLSLVLGIGFSSINPLDAASWKSAAGGAAIWSAIAFLIATFFGGWAAGSHPGGTRRHGVMKGITLWGLIMLTLVLLVGWAASSALGTASGMAGSALTAVVPTAAQVGTADLQGVLQSNGINITPAQTTDVSTRLAAGDRSGAASTLARDAGISTAKANSVLGQVTSSAQPATSAVKSSAPKVAEGTKAAGGKVAWGGFWLSLISLGCAILGGVIGAGGKQFAFRHA